MLVISKSAILKAIFALYFKISQHSRDDFNEKFS